MHKQESKPRAPLPEPGQGKRGEEGHLGYLLRQAAGAVRGLIEQSVNEVGITAPQFVVLTLIGAYPGLSNAELARLSHLTPQTVNVIVANLKRSGFVSSQAHSTHGRIQQLDLTATGTEVLGQSRPKVKAIEDRLAAGLTEREEGIVRRWLVRIAVESTGATI